MSLALRLGAQPTSIHCVPCPRGEHILQDKQTVYMEPSDSYRKTESSENVPSVKLLFDKKMISLEPLVNRCMQCLSPSVIRQSGDYSRDASLYAMCRPVFSSRIPAAAITMFLCHSMDHRTSVLIFGFQHTHGANMIHITRAAGEVNRWRLYEPPCEPRRHVPEDTLNSTRDE